MRIVIAMACILAATSGCVSYTGVAMTTRAVYLIGSTSFLGISSPWVKRCHYEQPRELVCATLSVSEGAAPGEGE